jgi:uncharacterized protein (DUF433 family)
VVDPDVRFGKPIIQGTRVPVEIVLAKLSGGMTVEQVCEEYEITVNDVQAAFAYAAQVIAREEIQLVA